MKKYNYGLLKMKRQTFPSYFSILAILIITLYSCQEDHIINNTAYNEGDFEAEASESVEGIIRLKLREDNINDLSISLKSGNIQSNIEGLDSILNAIGAMSFKRTFPNSGKYEERTMAKGMHLWYDISYDTCQASLAKVIGKFKNLNEVEITEPIKKIITPAYSIQKLDPVLLEHTLKSTASTSNDYPFSDPFLSYQWHYYNDGTVNDALEGCDINLFNAWLKQKGSPEVIVAVIDGGIDITHEDLATNIWVNTSEYNGSSKTDDDGNGYKDDIYGYNFVDNNGTIEPNDHGTHVAGIIGAENGNNIGLCGIAGGDVAIPGVRLMSCQVFETDAMGNETSADNFAEAIKYAADNGAVICQNSWGYDELSYLPESMKAAIDYFIEFAGIDENGVQIGPMSGGIVIFASGNESSTTNAYPAMYDPVIAVTSLSANFTMPYYSNYGSWVDIAAPGGVDSSEDYYDNWIASTVTDNEYAYLIGTSMACPHVSGVAALIVSEFGGQGFTPDMLKERLYYGAINVDIYNNNYQGMLGNGLINAAACLSELNSIPPEPVTDLTAIVDGNDISLTWTVTNDVDDLKPTGYKIYYSKNYFSTADITENNTSLSSAIQLVQLHEVGDTISLTINNLDYASNYYFRIAAYDVLGSYSEYSESLLVITAENHAPTITSNSGNSFKLKAHETYTFTCSLADQDGDSYTWNISDSAGNITTEGTTSEIIITIHGLTATPGTYQPPYSLKMNLAPPRISLLIIPFKRTILLL
ncbi:S8 family serine peptidase [Saccharicrinis fermentans]|uniref:Thermophilic serine proteinase n=1 Tax=Saccharicrinis fermentans DSM 9555 = JCM 21142 TaxID=869213 RepID=W7YNC0_9BACT|nr:S8 family serine peptidase [Saccharicrinis fermentans]GAF03934.1 thermophilic serine proteinase precursor [Saccharicrinis fermentans DSM 9555 = JCM 21142]